MQIKITISHHLLHTHQYGYSQNVRQQQVLARKWKNWNPHTLLMEYKMVQPLWKTAQQFLKMLNIDFPYDPAVLLSGIYPREMETCVHTKTHIDMLTAALFIMAPKWEQPKCPSTDECKNKIQCIHTMECQLAIKRNEVLIHNMDKL